MPCREIQTKFNNNIILAVEMISHKAKLYGQWLIN